MHIHIAHQRVWIEIIIKPSFPARVPVNPKNQILNVRKRDREREVERKIERNDCKRDV